MRSSDSPYITDWFLVSLRWLFLLGVILSLALGGQLLILPNLLLIGWACWNIAMTLLAVLNRRLPRHREINLGIDLLIAGLYFILAGGFASPACWIIFLPLDYCFALFRVNWCTHFSHFDGGCSNRGDCHPNHHSAFLAHSRFIHFPDHSHGRGVQLYQPAADPDQPPEPAD